MNWQAISLSHSQSLQWPSLPFRESQPTNKTLVGQVRQFISNSVTTMGIMSILTKSEQRNGQLFCYVCYMVKSSTNLFFSVYVSNQHHSSICTAAQNLLLRMSLMICRWGRFPPEVRTAIPVEGRFEHIVLSCNSTSDHSLVWIEREAQKKLDMMKESNEIAASPAHQKMERKQTLEEEHRDALERAVALQVPRAALPSDPKADLIGSVPSENNNGKPNSESDSKSSGKTNWVDLVDKLFSRNDFGGLILKTDISVI